MPDSGIPQVQLRFYDHLARKYLDEDSWAAVEVEGEFEGEEDRSERNEVESELLVEFFLKFLQSQESKWSR